EQEQGNENVSIDPAHYLSKKEKKEWKRLSYTAKQRYIRQAERQLKRQKKRNGIAKTEPSSVQEKEKQAAKIFSKERKYRSNTWKEPVDKKEIGSHGGNGEIASKSRDSRAAIRSQSTVAGGEKAVDIASSSTSAETAKAAGNAATKTVDTAAASTGAGLAALVAKKTAENFKEMLQQKNTAIESQRIKTQTKLSRLIEENKTAGSPGVAAAAMLASVVVTVMYFAAQIAVTIFFVLLILLIPIIVIVSFLGIIITLLSGFAAAVDNTDYASGSGASIVAVAVQEIGYHEGAGNHTKYGVYTGTDGMSWCHAFVSWCANECGFIESNIIPKTAACETGRQWFIHKQQYQKAGSYTPQAGDIIYFDKGGVGESHHVGIVEYVENGIVHTIEGNKNNQVMRGHYELTYKGIMGYGTPDYPDEGLTSSTASEILSKAQEIGKMMVEEKWVYSNTDLKGSLAAAEQSAKRTNCAHGVCLVLQEVGLLKKGQIFFGNKSGELSCNGTVRKQIEKGFDIIKTGGKKSKDLDLKPGDICLFKGHTNIYAGKDENGKTYWYDFGRDQTKDKKPGSVFVKSVRKGEINWAVITVILRVKDQDSYGSGKTINIPSPYGDSFTYMGWSLITSTGSNQYKLRVKTGEHYDANGFGKIGDRYVIACTPTFGKIGDEIDFVLANGRVIHGVMGDEKNMSDAGCNKWGHDGGHSVVEFVVNKSMWYHTGKTVTRFHPEWAKSRVVKAVNLGKNHLR
ncbi:CHAP domain-containing protein, partial [Anaerobutyricum hallii]